MATEEAEGSDWQKLRADQSSVVTLDEGESTLLEVDIGTDGVYRIVASALDDGDVDPSLRLLKRIDDLDILLQVDANDDGPGMGLDAAITGQLSVEESYLSRSKSSLVTREV